MNTKRRLYPKPKKYGEPWYSGVHYTYSQSFPTFARLTSGRKYLSNLLQRLVKEPANTTALEIGPGLSPLTTLLPFKKVFFLEKSKAVADDLGYSKIKKRVNYRRVVEDRIKDSSFENSRVIVGDLRALPFGLKTSFGVIIMNEVLTHVIPSERLSVIAELAEKTDRILLVDRKLMPLEELKRSHIEYAKKELKYMERYSGADAEKRRAELLKDVALSDYYAKRLQELLINFPKIVKYLENNGWRVQTFDKKGEIIDPYTVLLAEKIK
ncbi:MAG TPA: class I SAM-dependent methyltransferase [archaeon]|nr:class I SAM-dependent methyltransferase [archaeon]